MPTRKEYVVYTTVLCAIAMTIILATPNCDPAAEWDKFVETMMPRVQPVLDELNTGILGK